MLKVICITLVLLLSIPLNGWAKDIQHPSSLKAAFIRNGDLWISARNQQKRITHSGNVSSPLWSHDGTWIAYLHEAPSDLFPTKRETELYAYNTNSGLAKKLYYEAHHPQLVPASKCDRL